LENLRMLEGKRKITDQKGKAGGKKGQPQGPKKGGDLFLDGRENDPLRAWADSREGTATRKRREIGKWRESDAETRKGGQKRRLKGRGKKSSLISR